jgi:prepilin-type N-terminal cleavage/methylation domain-containing protein
MRGFTLLETLIALAIGAVVAGILAIVTSVGIAHIRKAKRVERLQANAVFIANAFSYWTRQGLLASTPSSTQLNLIVPTATSTRVLVFKKDGNRVTLDGAALTTDDVRMERLSLRALPRSVRMGFTLRVQNGSESLSATTTQALRNEF